MEGGESSENGCFRGYAEDQARKRQPLYMADWRRKLDAFLQFNEREILQSAGIVTMEVAKRLAEAEYDKFHARRLTEEANAEPVEDIDGLRKRLGPNKENQEKDEEGNR